MFDGEVDDDDDVVTARAIFEGRVKDKSACVHCAGIHAFVAGLLPHQQPCPRIKRVERDRDGYPLVTEYWDPGLWEEDVVFPHDLDELDEEH